MRLLTSFLFACTLLQPLYAGLLATSQETNTTRAYNVNFGGFLSGGYLGVTVDEFGRIYIADAFGDIVRYSNSGTFMGVFGSVPSNQFDVFNGLAVGPGGYLYAATTGDAVYRFDLNGGSRTEFIAAGHGGLDGAYGVAVDSLGNLYVAGYNSGQIHKYDSSGVFIGNFTSGMALDTPAAPTFGPDGMLYVSDYAVNKVHRFNGTTGAWNATMDLTDELSGALGLAFGPNSTLYVSSLLKNQILTYNYATGAYTGIYQSSATDAGLLSPTYLAYVSDVPEPGTFALAGIGLVAAVLVRRAR